MKGLILFLIDASHTQKILYAFREARKLSDVVVHFLSELLLICCRFPCKECRTSKSHRFLFTTPMPYVERRQG
jgi:hypothetical protein